MIEVWLSPKNTPEDLRIMREMDRQFADRQYTIIVKPVGQSQGHRSNARSQYQTAWSKEKIRAK